MFDWFKTRIVEIVAWLGELWKDAFTASWDFMKDAFCWVIDQLLSLVVSAVGLLDVSGLQGWVSQWGTLPGEIVNVMGLLGVGTASAIIVSAAGIRLVLQLIPFTRLGS